MYIVWFTVRVIRKLLTIRGGGGGGVGGYVLLSLLFLIAGCEI